ncbi:MAG TPA: insulinase family protein, partial [Bacteroidota bacterium]|nr:insulinase family protein [Bacteroidota bacterium]
MSRAFLCFSFFFLVLPLNPMRGQSPVQKVALAEDQVLPLDPKITLGRLDNGLTYYIRVNKKPERRAELRLVVNAGSVLETDEQRGIAHFVEHMAFNGSKNFRKQDLVNYLESVGVRFGADLNAGTGFDETVYRLQVPTDTPSILQRGFDILEDWAHQVTFDDDAIEKERGVITEEWRLGRGAAARINDKQFPILFSGSRYADRLPIGLKTIIESCSHQTIRQFYRDWYRPDLMAVVAVGDFDVKEIEDLILRHFAKIPAPQRETARLDYPVPDHRETLFAIASDPEATSSSVGVVFKRNVEPLVTVRDYRRDVVEQLASGMLNYRLYEIARKPEAPFLYAYASDHRLVRTKDAHVLGATVKDNGVERGLEALLTEARRVKLYGFTSAELDRQKKNILRSLQNAYDEREKTESAYYVSECINHFLDKEPSPGIEYERALFEQFLPTLSLEELNAKAQSWITQQNRVVTVAVPQKAGIRVPSTEDLTGVITSVDTKEITPYTENVPQEPLVKTPPQPGSIREEKTYTDIAVTQWTLSNGVRVYLKPTDFKNDEIVLTGFHPGGTSLSSDSDFVPAITASAVVSEGGVGDFDLIALQKKLAGKIVNMGPYIGEWEEGVNGSSSANDVATMFQLLYLDFTAPRMDSVAYATYQERVKNYLKNRSARPESAFEDTLQLTLNQYHPRRRPFSQESFQRMSLRRSYDFYRDRFADAGGFTFVIAGSFSLENIRPLVLTYLGGLSSSGRNESWRDEGIREPTGVIEKSVHRGIEPKSQVRIVFTGPFHWSEDDRHAINSLAAVMQIKLREALREEKGGTYGVGVWASPHHYPTEDYELGVSFGCAPERVAELTRTTFDVIDSVQRFGPAETYVTRVKETQRREREVALRQNGFWIGAIKFLVSNHEEPTTILQYEQSIEKVT